MGIRLIAITGGPSALGYDMSRVLTITIAHTLCASGAFRRWRSADVSGVRHVPSGAFAAGPPGVADAPAATANERAAIKRDDQRHLDVLRCVHVRSPSS